eukprot:624859-Pelagomonas_calceolata.AAC.9
MIQSLNSFLDYTSKWKVCPKQGDLYLNNELGKSQARAREWVDTQGLLRSHTSSGAANPF